MDEKNTRIRNGSRDRVLRFSMPDTFGANTRLIVDDDWL